MYVEYLLSMSWMRFFESESCSREMTGAFGFIIHDAIGSVDIQFCGGLPIGSLVITPIFTMHPCDPSRLLRRVNPGQRLLAQKIVTLSAFFTESTDTLQLAVHIMCEILFTSAVSSEPVIFCVSLISSVAKVAYAIGVGAVSFWTLPRKEGGFISARSVLFLNPCDAYTVSVVVFPENGIITVIEVVFCLNTPLGHRPLSLEMSVLLISKITSFSFSDGLFRSSLR